MQIRLILLDFDGTLADTRRANTLAYVATLREAGYALTEEEYAAKYFGMRCNEFLTRYGIADPGERERLRLRKIALYPAFFDTVRLNRPLWEFCRQFRAQGGRVWIVSTGSRANIDNAMRHLGITVTGQRAGSPAPAWTKRKWSELARVRPQRAWTEPVWKERAKVRPERTWIRPEREIRRRARPDHIPPRPEQVRQPRVRRGIPSRAKGRTAPWTASSLSLIHI